MISARTIGHRFYSCSIFLLNIILLCGDCVFKFALVLLNELGVQIQCRKCKRRGFDPWIGKILEKGMAAHSSILDWEIPRTEETVGRQSMGLQRVECD